MGTTAPWPVGLSPLSASPSLVLGSVCTWCPRLPRGLQWDPGLPAATPSLQTPGVLTVIPAPFAHSTASSDLGAQAIVLVPQEPSDPGLVLFHPTTCHVSPAPQPGTRGPRGPSRRWAWPGQRIGRPVGSALPPRPLTSPSAVCPGWAIGPFSKVLCYLPGSAHQSLAAWPSGLEPFKLPEGSSHSPAPCGGCWWGRAHTVFCSRLSSGFLTFCYRDILTGLGGAATTGLGLVTTFYQLPSSLTEANRDPNGGRCWGRCCPEGSRGPGGRQSQRT